MIAGEVLSMLVEDLVAWSHHDRGPELGRAPPGPVLAVPAEQRADRGTHGRGARQGSDPERVGGDDLCRHTVLVEQDGERNALVIDECGGVALSSGTDRSEPCPDGENLVVSIADLTGPLATRQSAEVAQEQQNVRPVRPEIPEPMRRALWGSEDLVGEESGIERHESSWRGAAGW